MAGSGCSRKAVRVVSEKGLDRSKPDGFGTRACAFGFTGTMRSETVARRAADELRHCWAFDQAPRVVNKDFNAVARSWTSTCGDRRNTSNRSDNNCNAGDNSSESSDESTVMTFSVFWR